MIFQCLHDSTWADGLIGRSGWGKKCSAYHESQPNPSARADETPCKRSLGNQSPNLIKYLNYTGVRALHVHLRLLLPSLHAALRAPQVLHHLLGHPPLEGSEFIYSELSRWMVN